MKHSGRFILLLVIAVGIVVFARQTPEKVVGNATQALKVCYTTKKADEVNSQKIGVSVDGDLVFENTKKELYMTRQMALMADVRRISGIFRCDVDRISEQEYRFTWNLRQIVMCSGEDTYTVNGEAREAADPLVFRFDQVYVRLDVLAEAFGWQYVWDDQNNQARLTCAVISEKALPEIYDMRKTGRTSPVRSQGNFGTCWAFAALGALESSLFPGQPLVFSVDHMSFLTGFNRTQQEGGDFNMALAYLASWKGPVKEEDDPYGDGVTDDSLEAVVHLQEAVNIAPKDHRAIKEMILEYGGVQSSFYSDMETATSNSGYYNSKTFAYYYPGANLANHDVVIVGWDDHFPKENFNVYPENDGAFICRNSWGTVFGEEGYFYISYEDTNIATNNMVYTKIEAADNYDHIYQTDLLGWIGTIGYGGDTAWFANVYKAESEQRLRAVSFYTTGADNFYDIFIVRDFTDTGSFGTMEYMKSGYIADAGYYTVELEPDIGLDARKAFAVVVCIRTLDSERPVAIEYDAGELTEDVIIDDGEGYLSYDGVMWENMEQVYTCNVCLKAFTDDQ